MLRLGGIGGVETVRRRRHVDGVVGPGGRSQHHQDGDGRALFHFFRLSRISRSNSTSSGVTGTAGGGGGASLLS